MDEVAFLRRTLRIYRAAFRDVLEAASLSQAQVAKRIADLLYQAQGKVDRLKDLAPASVLPEAARQRDRTQPLEAFP